MKTLFLAFTAAFCAAARVFAQDATAAWAQPRIDKSTRHLEWVTVKHDGREVGCYVGYPEVKDKATAVLVIHEIFGHTAWVQETVDELAAAGYIVIAPDLLWGAGPKGGGTSELSSADIRLKISALPADQKTADLNAAVDYIVKQPSCNGTVVVAGFCWGGGESFRFATNNQAVKAAFVFYGTPPPAADMARIKCPIYGFYAENDARVTATVATATGQMKAAGKDYEPVVYAGASHGFMRLGVDPTANATTNAANIKARTDAWKRALDILKGIANPAPTAVK
jgi:carboxymethylenebutenolidase